MICVLGGLGGNQASVLDLVIVINGIAVIQVGMKGCKHAILIHYLTLDKVGEGRLSSLGKKLEFINCNMLKGIN
jgi:hypothetical protein